MQKFQIGFLLFLFIFGLAVGFGVSQFWGKTIKAEQITPEYGECEFKFINPNRCDPKLRIEKKEYTVFRQSLEKFISEQVKKNKADEVAVYFRDLENGPTFEINSRTEFAPSSLLKVPLMMAVLKATESDPKLLTTEIELQLQIEDTLQPLPENQQLQKGMTYTFDELLERMIRYSDNTATVLLKNKLDQDSLYTDLYRDTLSDLGIKDFTLNETAGEDFISVKTYASLFRLLYNGSFLNLEMSEKALKLLTQVEFDRGLTAGVPESVPVAHKFGSRDMVDKSAKQLHDCGIIYHPDTPYLLCIMTKGDNISELVSVIKVLSQKVYAEVSARS